LQNKRKQCLFLALSKDFSAVSAGRSEVIAASLDRQFHDSADFADHSTGSLDSSLVSVLQTILSLTSGLAVFGLR